MYTITALGHQLLLPIAENLWVFHRLSLPHQIWAKPVRVDIVSSTLDQSYESRPRFFLNFKKYMYQG